MNALRRSTIDPEFSLGRNLRVYAGEDSASRSEKYGVFALLLADLFILTAVAENFFSFPHVIKYLISMFCLWGLCLHCFRSRMRFAGNSFGWLELMYLWFTCWSVFLVVESVFSYRGDIHFLQAAFGSRYFLVPYLAPIVLVFSTYSVGFFCYLFKISYRLLLVGIVLEGALIVLSRNDVVEWYLSYAAVSVFQLGGAGLLLVSHVFREAKVAIVCLTFHLLMLFLFMFQGRRGLTLDIVLLLLAFVAMRLSSTRVFRSGKKALLLILVVVAVFLVAGGFNVMTERLLVFERGFDLNALMNSRGRVWTDFFEDFHGVGDWVVGRGLNGTVLRTISEDEIGRVVETGYLYVIFKGGLLYLFPMLMILFRAAYLGIFRTKNDLTRSLGVLVTLYVGRMVSFGLPDFSTSYLLVWVAAAACLSKDLRGLSQSDFFVALNSQFMKKRRRVGMVANRFFP